MSMRLEVLEKKSGLLVRASKVMTGVALGPMAVMKYRPAFFGRYYKAALCKWLSGSPQWSRGEQELMAAFVSTLNQCEF